MASRSVDAENESKERLLNDWISSNRFPFQDDDKLNDENEFFHNKSILTCHLPRLKTLLLVGLFFCVCLACVFIGHRLPRRAFSFKYVGTSIHISGPWRPKEVNNETAVSAAQNISASYLPKSLTKPEGIRIIGFMFFGRRRYVDMLDCYLRKNLAINGGFLDEVHFITDRTWDQKDIDWLSDMVETKGMQKQYIIKENHRDHEAMHWSELWGHHINDPEAVYIKIDDDIVFMTDNAIPRLVHTLLANPTAHSVQANIVNSRQTEWFHLHTGATLAFLPEMEKSWRKGHPKSKGSVWRHSTLPHWPGDDKLRDSFNWTKGDWKPPFRGHRWLPLEQTPENLVYTPIWQASNPDDLKFRYSRWPLAAQEHYSLFYHLETDTLGSYYWGDVNGIWNPWYKHYDINLMAIVGQTVLDTHWWEWPREVNDQWALTQTAPEVMKRPFLVDSHAIAAHFAFSLHERKLLKTDLLDRYRAYANENVCGPDNQKSPIR